MLDTHAIARQLTAAGIDPAHADVITDVVRQAADHGDYVTRAELRADLAALENRLIKWIIGTAVTVAGIAVAAGTAFLVAVLRALS